VRGIHLELAKVVTMDHGGPWTVTLVGVKLPERAKIALPVSLKITAT
jgi:hypothetical protein